MWNISEKGDAEEDVYFLYKRTKLNIIMMVLASFWIRKEFSFASLFEENKIEKVLVSMKEVCTGFYHRKHSIAFLSIFVNIISTIISLK